MGSAMGGLTIVWAIIVLVIAVLWVLMPFAIFGTKDLLRQLIREQKKTNELLQAQADRAKAIREQVGRIEPQL
jgi:heme exporter protein D